MRSLVTGCLGVKIASKVVHLLNKAVFVHKPVELGNKVLYLLNKAAVFVGEPVSASKFNSSDKVLHLLNKAVFVVKPVFWFPDGLGLQRKFWEKSKYLEAPQGREQCNAERPVELYSDNQQ